MPDFSDHRCMRCGERFGGPEKERLNKYGFTPRNALCVPCDSLLERDDATEG